jgi:hypothetical protein
MSLPRLIEACNKQRDLQGTEGCGDEQYAPQRDITPVKWRRVKRLGRKKRDQTVEEYYQLIFDRLNIPLDWNSAAMARYTDHNSLILPPSLAAEQSIGSQSTGTNDEANTDFTVPLPESQHISVLRQMIASFEQIPGFQGNIRYEGLKMLLQIYEDPQRTNVSDPGRNQFPQYTGAMTEAQFDDYFRA